MIQIVGVGGGFLILGAYYKRYVCPAKVEYRFKPRTSHVVHTVVHFSLVQKLRSQNQFSCFFSLFTDRLILAVLSIYSSGCPAGVFMCVTVGACVCLSGAM